MFNVPEDEEELVSAINTTPLVDVMLVLLIIFLITIPVATHTVKVDLPKDKSQPTQTLADNIALAITENNQLYWNELPLSGEQELDSKLQNVAHLPHQPQIQIRGDEHIHYETIGTVIKAAQHAGIRRVDFIMEKPR